MEGGAFYDRLAIEFSLIDETKIPSNQRRGGATDLYMLVGDLWEYMNVEKMKEDTKLKMVLAVNHLHTTISGSAATYAHELTVHGALFIKKIFPKLINEGLSAFINEYYRAIELPRDKLEDVNKYGYFTQIGSHMIYALGLNEYYTRINNEIKKILNGNELQSFTKLINEDINRAIEET